MTSRLFRALLLTLLAAALLPAAANGLPELPSSAFKNTAGCTCHSVFRRTWAQSMHAQALSDPIFRHELERAVRATDGLLGPFCNGCHAPVAVMAGELTGIDQSGVSAVGREGVFCDFCHQVTGRAGDRPGNTSVALDSPDGTKRAQFDDALSPYHETAYSAFHESAEFCGNCHDVYHPINGLPLEATYTEWLDSPYAADGIVCQDCHMTPGPGPVKPYPGKAASFGPDRDHIYLMMWAGGNTALGPADLAEERLQAAAEITLVTPEYIPDGETGRIEVTVANVGAGHYLPTGLTEYRQMWLEVEAVDSEGDVVMSEEHRYGLELGDDEGNSPVDLWEATNIASDDRIPPKESRTYDYELTMPPGGVAEITAVLYYRSISEELAEEIDIAVPTTTMYTVSATVYDSADSAAEALREAQRAARKSGQPEGFNALWIAVLGLGAAIGIILLAARRSGKHAQAS